MSYHSPDALLDVTKHFAANISFPGIFFRNRKQANNRSDKSGQCLLNGCWMMIPCHGDIVLVAIMVVWNLGRTGAGGESTTEHMHLTPFSVVVSW